MNPNHFIGRREFIQAAGAAVSGTFVSSAQARQPIERSGPPRFQFGLAAYSLRQYFAHHKGKSQQPSGDGPPLDMFGFIDYCAAHGFEGAELTSYFFPPDLNREYLLRLKRHAFESGVSLCGAAIGNDFTVGEQSKLDTEVAMARQWIDRTALLGAPHLRIFAGTAAQLARGPERLTRAIEAIEVCATHAAERGVYLGVENHGRLSADQVLQIMRRVQSPWVGVNLDTGNFISDDPYADLAACAPFAVNVQVKAKLRLANGQRADTDYARIAEILKQANYQGYIVLEYEEAAPYEQIPEAFAKLWSAFA